MLAEDGKPPQVHEEEDPSMTTPAPKRSERFTIRFRPHRAAAIEEAAAKRQETVTELIRRAAVEAAENVLQASEKSVSNGQP